MMFRVGLLNLVLACLLVGCGEEIPPDPNLRTVTIRNESSTEANVRIKRWHRELTRVSAGDVETIEFISPNIVVNVEAQTRKQWDSCWSSMRVGGTFVVYDDTERIACRVE